MNTAQTILSQIQSGYVPGCQNGFHAMMCWGAKDFTNLGESLRFKVNGFKLKGTVTVDYVQGSDDYTLKFKPSRKVEVTKYENVYCDQLAELIDNEVEGIKTN